MIRTFAWFLGALALAGIVHIVTVLGLPRYATADPWRTLSAFVGPEGFTTLPRAAPGAATLPGLDPAMMHAICRFSLDRGPMRIKAETTDGYWSLSLYDRRGLWVWGVDNRAAEPKPIDVLIATDVQVAQLRETLPEELEDMVIVDWPEVEGFAVYKVLVPTPSQQGEIEKIVGSAKCTAAPLQ